MILDNRGALSMANSTRFSAFCSNAKIKVMNFELCLIIINRTVIRQPSMLIFYEVFSRVMHLTELSLGNIRQNLAEHFKGAKLVNISWILA